jgi:hypothetical protein
MADAYFGVTMNLRRNWRDASAAHTLWRELRFCNRKRLQLEATGDCHVAALLAMTKTGGLSKINSLRAGFMERVLNLSNYSLHQSNPQHFARMCGHGNRLW